MNPIQTPPQSPDVDKETGHDDPLDALLTQLINGFFVLTDGQGAVSKWSEPAELLFGLDAAEVLGKGLFDTLVDHAPARSRGVAALPREAARPRAPARCSRSARSTPPTSARSRSRWSSSRSSSTRASTSRSSSRTSSFELPRNLMLMRMRQQHPVVVRALRQALEAEPQPWDGWRTAGTLVAFRPTQPTPWVEEELAAPRVRTRGGRHRGRGAPRSRSRHSGRLDRRPRRRRRSRRPPAVRAGAHRGPREDRR